MAKKIVKKYKLVHLQIGKIIVSKYFLIENIAKLKLKEIIVNIIRQIKRKTNFD